MAARTPPIWPREINGLIVTQGKAYYQQTYRLVNRTDGLSLPRKIKVEVTPYIHIGLSCLSLYLFYEIFPTPLLPDMNTYTKFVKKWLMSSETKR